METRANYALIGLFTLAVVVIGFAFVWWIAGRSQGGERERYVVRFEGSVSGLGEGSSVLYNGLRVGEVIGVVADDDPRFVRVRIQVRPEVALITEGTRARLEFQGLTGIASIQLFTESSNRQPLRRPGDRSELEIPSVRSDFQDLLASAQRLAAQAGRILDGVEGVVGDNRAGVRDAISNIERFSRVLADRTDAIDRFLATVGNVGDRIGTLAGTLDGLAKDVDGIVRAIEPERVGQIVRNVETVTATFARSDAEITAVIREAATLARSLNATAARLDAVLADVGAITRAIDPNRINQTFDGAARFVATLERNAPQVEKALTEASEITGKLNRSADRVDGVLLAVQQFLGTGEGGIGTPAQGALADVGEAARSIRRLADNLDKRTAEITAGISRFTGSGSRDIEALAADSRRTLNDIGRTLRSLERNPQQLLLGPRSNVPQYDGRR